jgi:predicted metal-dependent RNase
MKYGKTQLLDPAVTRFPRLETLMIESTYGGKDNNLPTREEDEATFAEIVKRTVEGGGKVLVSVLGVGRAQEVMVILERMIREKKIPDINIYIDGMVWDVTAIHTAYPEYLNSQIRTSIFHKNHNPFLSECFKRVGSAKERKQVIEETGACVVLATSGMLQGGPSVEYLKNFGSFSKNAIIFVSYQGEGSLGKRIQRGEREIMFREGGKTDVVQLKLDINTIDGFTGHSGRQELMNFVKRCTPRPKKIVINHGESSRVLDLASSLHKAYRVETVAPRNLETVRVK